MKIAFQPLSNVMGAQVTGINLADPIDDATLAMIRQAWLTYHLLVFRDVDMTPVQHVAFSRRLGELHIMPLAEYNLPGIPEIFVISNIKQNKRYLGMRRVGLGWHTDGEDKPLPNAGSFLYALQVPPEGGDTLYANLHAVYDALPATTKARIEGRRARYSRAQLHAVHYPDLPPLTEAQLAAWPDVYHPLVRTHPETGRKALYIGRWACEIEGLPKAEGRALIAELQAFSTQPQFVYRHQWRLHDALLWDNRCLQHSATGFDESRYQRHMHRTTLEGDTPYFDGGSGIIRSAIATVS
jgi:taurine dioxygenase/putative 2-oxoglutarate oxygenase